MKKAFFASKRGRIITFLGVASIATAAVAAATTTQKTAGGTISMGPSGQYDVYKVPLNAGRDGNGNDARAERFYNTRINATETSKKFTFQATYYITSANNTTVAQMLNYDSSKSDRNKPVLFLVAFQTGTTSTGKPIFKICQYQSCAASWSNIGQSFTLKITTSGKEADVWVNGVKKTFDITKDSSGNARTGGRHTMRWGAYHHDYRGKSTTQTAAQVRVYNLAPSGF